jgi:hypothetical protein
LKLVTPTGSFTLLCQIFDHFSLRLDELLARSEALSLNETELLLHMVKFDDCLLDVIHGNDCLGE